MPRPGNVGSNTASGHIGAADAAIAQIPAPGQAARSSTTSLGSVPASAARSTADLGALEDEAEQQSKEQAARDYAALLGQLKALLAGKVWDVRISSRLTTSPACIVANERG